MINKIDQIDNKNKLLPFIDEISNEYSFKDILLFSAKTKDGLENLISLISKNLPENKYIYDENFNIQKDNKFIFSEMIREKIIRKLGDEIPYDTFVEIDKCEDKKAVSYTHLTLPTKRIV